MTDASELIANARALLLDFDGPVTALMPPPLNAQAAQQARTALVGVDLPNDVANTTDHLAVLRFAAEHAPGRLQAVEQSCTDAELTCARESDPSPEIFGLLADAETRGVPVAIVSNNSEAAVRYFLARFDWTRSAIALACRTPDIVIRLKPDPYLVSKAVRQVGVEPASCVFVGDSVSDVQAGTAAGVVVVGLAKTESRGHDLHTAGAAAIFSRSSK